MAVDSTTMLVGGAAALCTTLSFVPQLVKIHRQGGRDLSDGMLALYLVGLTLWLAYGIRIGAAEIIGANVVAGVLVLAALVMKHRAAAAARPGAAPARGRTLAHPDCRRAIQQRLRALRPDCAPRWGRMTAPQMVRHLIDCHHMALGELAVTAPETRLPRAFVKWVSLYTPLPWPAGLPTSPELDQEVGGTRPGGFAQDVAALDATMSRLVERAGRSDWPSHPDFGRMSDGDWLRWAWRHVDHHLRQFGC